MSIRFYPDLVVAVYVSDALKEHASYYHGNIEKTMNAAKAIILNPKFFHRRQKHVLATDWANVFFGYGEGVWTEENYRQYLEKHPDLFYRLTDVYPRELCGGCIFKLLIKEKYKDVNDFIYRTCRKMIENNYPDEVLKYFGLVPLRERL